MIGVPIKKAYLQLVLSLIMGMMQVALQMKLLPRRYILGGVGMTGHLDNKSSETPIISINITSHAQIVTSFGEQYHSIIHRLGELEKLDKIIT